MRVAGRDLDYWGQRWDGLMVEHVWNLMGRCGWRFVGNMMNALIQEYMCHTLCVYTYIYLYVY